MYLKKDGSPIHYKASNTTFEAPSPTSRVCKAYYASFDTIDSALDIIKKGAFTKSINERGPKSKSNRQIKFLHQHNTQEPCATFNDLYEDSVGLGGEHVVEKSPLGDIIIERYANGIYKEHSIGFQYVWEKCQWVQIPLSFVPPEIDADEYMGDEGQPTGTTMVFECKELNLFENSVVTFGCNPNTPFLGFKGNKEDLVLELENELNFLIKNSPSYDYELQIRSLWAKQISLAKSLAEINTKEITKPKEEKQINIKTLINQFNLK